MIDINKSFLNLKFKICGFVCNNCGLSGVYFLII